MLSNDKMRVDIDANSSATTKRVDVPAGCCFALTRLVLGQLNNK